MFRYRRFYEAYFTSRKIIGSLFFPILICLIFGTSFVIFSIGKELNALRLGCLFSALLGGFLPIVITLIAKTDTSFYLKDRAIVSSISLVFIFIACLLNELLDSIYYAWCVIFLFVILSTFYCLRKVQNGFRTVNCHYFKSDSVHSSVSDMLRL